MKNHTSNTVLTTNKLLFLFFTLWNSFLLSLGLSKPRPKLQLLLQCQHSESWVSQSSSGTQNRLIITNTNCWHAPSHEKRSHKCMLAQVTCVHRGYSQRSCIVTSSNECFRPVHSFGWQQGIIRSFVYKGSAASLKSRRSSQKS